MGGLLKDKLQLKAEPREHDPQHPNYRFGAKSEEKLTNWMTRNLLVSWRPCRPEKVREVKADAIRSMKPAMNIQYNSDGQFSEATRAARTVCREEARAKGEER